MSQLIKRKKNGKSKGTLIKVRNAEAPEENTTESKEKKSEKKN